jgi:hypothetical protein
MTAALRLRATYGFEPIGQLLRQQPRNPVSPAGPPRLAHDGGNEDQRADAERGDHVMTKAAFFVLCRLRRALLTASVREQAASLFSP